MKIKKLLIISLILGLSSSMVFADWIVPVTALPQKSRAFINSTFPGVQIWKVERDGGKFEVKLSNGVDIDFYMNGDWKDIDGGWVTIPFSVLPAAVANTVKQTYPQAAIIEAEKEWGNYKIKLNNFMELYITSNGQLIGQKFDD
ncbi:PepSY-like domain-containing protein [uncultured Brachyspira sp.]|uniref:PepSY-like domain-containing protein n=1 Tax=uncultured Brachyspira sp. TaxID=221953 RepID=UPI0027DD619A|nr:PepSY-like domain-containing protein [uncultured Brachyspira sp.]